MFKYIYKGRDLLMASTKQLIYETAKRLFLEEGYNVGSRRIAEVAGVNQGLLTYYFKSKSNIALTVLKENYEIVSSYVRYQVSPHDDTLLYILVYTTIFIKNSKLEPKYFRLLRQLSEDNLLEESVRHGNNQTSLYKTIIRDYMPPNNFSLEKNFDIFTGIIFGVLRNLILRLQENENNDITFEEYYGLFIRTFIWAAHLNYNEDEILQLIQKVESITAVSYTHLTLPTKRIE